MSGEFDDLGVELVEDIGDIGIPYHLFFSFRCVVRKAFADLDQQARGRGQFRYRGLVVGRILIRLGGRLRLLDAAKEPVVHALYPLGARQALRDAAEAPALPVRAVFEAPCVDADCCGKAVKRRRLAFRERAPCRPAIRQANCHWGSSG